MLSQSQYARRLGVSRVQVHKLVKNHVIPLHNGKIDPEEADQLLMAARHPSYDHARRAQLPFEDLADQSGPLPIPGPPPSLDPEGDKTNPAAIPFQQSRAVREYFQAKTAKLDFFERAGNLVDCKKVEEEAFELWRNYRDTWLNVPAKYSGEGAAALGLDAPTGQEALFLFLTNIINLTLEEFADGPCQSRDLPGSSEDRHTA